MRSAPGYLRHRGRFVANRELSTLGQAIRDPHSVLDELAARGHQVGDRVSLF